MLFHGALKDSRTRWVTCIVGVCGKPTRDIMKRIMVMIADVEILCTERKSGRTATC